MRHEHVQAVAAPKFKKEDGTSVWVRRRRLDPIEVIHDVVEIRAVLVLLEQSSTNLLISSGQSYLGKDGRSP